MNVSFDLHFYFALEIVFRSNEKKYGYVYALYKMMCYSQPTRNTFIQNFKFY